MRKLDRSLSPCPPQWAAQVRKGLRDHAEFFAQAAAFEQLAWGSPPREAGFSTYAPHVLKASKGGKSDFPNLWGKHKEAVAALSHRKCAYCESPIDAPRAANVEHFKPKAKFPSLAYEWTNYFIACTGCNGAKKAKWRDYPRPDEGDPSAHFDFGEDGSMRAVVLDGPADWMLLDLDMARAWLVEKRELNIGVMMRLLKVAVDFHARGHTDQARILAQTLLVDITAPERAYSVALTQCFWRVWNSACPGVEV